MKLEWPIFRRVADRAERGRKRLALRDARPKERLDFTIVMAAVTGMALLATGGYFGALWIDRAGFFDPEVVRPAPDERILSNFRQHSAPIVDATVLDSGSGPVLIGRSDGTLHFFDRETELFSDDELQDRDRLVSPLAQLATGCGWIDKSAGEDGCSALGRIFAVTNNGGLAERGFLGSWRTLVADRPWIGRSGKAVEQSDVIGWAASENGRYVLVVAGDKGAAILDQEGSLWSVVSDPGPLVDLGPIDKIRIVAQGSIFWIGSANGLARIDAAVSPAVIDWNRTRDLAIRDLTLDPAGRILAVIQAPCARGGQTGCLSIREVRALSNLATLVGEDELNPNLSDSSSVHATLQGSRIVVFGAGGINAYDMIARTWRVIEAAPVDTLHAARQGAEVYATVGERILKISAGAIAAEWVSQGAPFAQVLAMDDANVIVLDASGQLRNVSNGTILAFRDGGIPEKVGFNSGASNGTLAILLGRSGALVHDVAKRRFSWVSQSSLGPALSDRRARIYAAQGLFWVVDSSTGQVAKVTLAGNFPHHTLASVSIGGLSAPLRSVNATSEGLWLVDRNGVPFTVNIGTGGQPPLQRQIGSPRLKPEPLTTGVGSATRLVFANERTMWSYDLVKRDWKGPVASPSGVRIADIAETNRLYILANDGRIFGWEPNRWSVVFGGGSAAAFGSEQVTDALSFGGNLFVGGDGKVQRYDTDASQFSQPWAGGRGEVRIVGMQDKLPVWVSNKILRRGNTKLTDAPVLGAWRSGAGVLALLKGAESRRYTKYFPDGNATPVCTFYSSNPPGGQPVDAVVMPGGRLFVVTDQSAGIYVPDERRWLRVANFLAKDSPRLYLAGGYLLAVTDNSLRAVELAKIDRPASCASPEISLNWDFTFAGRSVEFDSDKGSAALLNNGGAVSVWQQGIVRPVLPSSNAGPDLAKIRRVVLWGQSLVFASNDGLWSYDTNRRRWKFARFNLSSGRDPRVSEVDIVVNNAVGVQVTVWTLDGRSFGGTWRTTSDQVSLNELRPVNLPKIATDPRRITGFTSDGTLWVVASEESMEIGPATASQLPRRLLYPAGEGLQPRPYRISDGETFLSGDPARPKTLWILPKNAEIGNLSGPLGKQTFRYSPKDDRDWLVNSLLILWRIDFQGRVLRCSVEAGRSIDQTCRVILQAPLSIAPQSLSQAFEYGGRVYLVLGNRVLSLDSDWRRPEELTGPKFGKDTVFFVHRQKLHVWERPGGDLWRLPGNGKAAERILAGVLYLSQSGSELYAETGDGLTINGDMPFDYGSSYDWVLGGQIIGLDRSGQVIGRSGQVISEVKIPDPATVRHVFRSWFSSAGGPPRLGVWVERAVPGSQNSTVNAFAISDCEVFPGSGLTTQCEHTAFTQDVVLQKGEQLRSPPNGSRQAIFSDQFALEIAQDGQPSAWQRLADAAWRTIAPVPSGLSRVLASLVSRGATSEVAPAINVGGGGVVNLGNGLGRTIATGQNTPQPWRAMNTGWMFWNADSRSITFNDINGLLVDIPIEEALSGGVFLPMQRGKGSFGDNGGGYTWQTVNALWEYPALGPPKLVVRHLLPVPETLFRGDYVLSDGRKIDRSSGAISRPRLRYEERVGNLIMAGEILPPRILARLERADGSTAPAFSLRGFMHDIRAGIGWRNGDLTLIGPGGLVSTSRLGDFDAGPAPGGQTVRVLSQGARVFGRTQNEWFVQTARGGWQATKNPVADWSTTTPNGIRWQFSSGRLDIRPPDAANVWRVRRSGLEFEVDRLVSIAGGNRTTVAVTGLGTHTFGTALDLSTPGNAVTAAPADVVELDSLAHRPGDFVIFARDPNGRVLSVWESSQRIWQSAAQTKAPAKTPWLRRLPVDDGVFQAAFSSGSLPEFHRTVILPGGSRRQAKFIWQSGGQMPFDTALSVYGERTELWVGTKFGLRRLGADASPVPGRKADIMDLSLSGRLPGTRKSAGSIPAVGRPAAKPGTLMAVTSDGGCATIGSAGIAQCSTPADLDNRMIAENSFWKWSKSRSALSGSYKIANSGGLAIDSNPSAYFPHDILTSFTTCQRRQIEVWARSDLVTHGRPATGRLVQVGRGPIRIAYCQAANSVIDRNTTLQAGTYLIGLAAVRLRNGQQWSTVSPTLVPPIQARALGRVPFDAKRIRMVLKDDGSLATEIRGAVSDWRDVPWIDGLPAIDLTLGIVKDNGLERLTQFGLSSYSPMTAPLRLNPRSVSFRYAQKDDAFLTCGLDSIEKLDGSDQAVDTVPGSPVQFRCRDGRVYRERPDIQTDWGAFTQLKDDPFARRDLVAIPGLWTWTRTSAAKDNAPSLEITFKDEPLPLSSGRFAIDDYRAIAGPFDGKTEIVSANGWWRHRDGDLSIAAAARTDILQNPADVVSVTLDIDDETDQLVACLDQGSSLSLIDEEDRPKSTEACGTWTGSDSVWTYRILVSGGIDASGKALNGPKISREIEGGRFSDLKVMGPPVPFRDSEHTSGGMLAAPSPVGVTLINENGRVGGYLSFPGTQAVIYQSAGKGGTILLTIAGPVLADGSPWMRCGQGFTEALRATAVSGVRKVEQSSGGALRVFPSIKPGAMDTWLHVISCEDGGVSVLRNASRFRVSDRVRHVSVTRSLADASPVLQVTVANQNITIADGRARRIGVAMPDDGQGPDYPVSIVSGDMDRAAITVTGSDVYLVDSDAAISRLSRTRNTAIPIELKEIQPRSTDANIVFMIDHRDRVRKIQWALAARGFYQFEIDGLAGPGTRRGIRLYQNSLDEIETGALTRRQYRRLTGQDIDQPATLD